MIVLRASGYSEVMAKELSLQSPRGSPGRIELNTPPHVRRNGHCTEARPGEDCPWPKEGAWGYSQKHDCRAAGCRSPAR